MTLSGSSVRAQHFRLWAASPVRRDCAPAQAPDEIKHGLSAYRSGKCKCNICREAHRVASAEYRARRARGEATAREPRSQRLARAKVFLDDGASYAEAAESVATDEKTLSEDLPGYSANGLAFNSIMSSIKNKPRLLELHREIWQGGQYNQN